MSPVRKRKMITLFIFVAIIAAIVALVLYALRQNISLFYSPTQVTSGEAPYNHTIRVGGMVVKDSVKRSSSDLAVCFKITDYKNTMEIAYRGILPDLFREGQGIVAQGTLNDKGQFNAVEVLAKHDENYMPPEVKGILNN